MRRLIITAGAATALALAIAGPASASVTIDPATGTGFVPKGDVQSVLGWNNSVLQAKASGVTFSYSQATTQSLDQNVSQVVTQDGTQVVSQDVECIAGDVRHREHREGVRSGTREGSRDGSRSGSRTGVINGAISGNIAYLNRTMQQITGFNLTGFTSGTATSNDPSWGVIGYGDPTFEGAEWSMGDTEWGGWTTDAGEGNPAVCLGGNPDVTDLVVTPTEDEIVPVEDSIEYGTESFDEIAYGPVVRGAVAVSATHASVGTRLLP